MNPVDRDDFVHALGQTMLFYGKDLDKVKTSFWITACGGKPVSKLKWALLEHVKHGKYAPRPAEILGLIDAAPSQAQAALPPPPETNCPPEIADAWSWFIKMNASDGKNKMVAGSVGKRVVISPELQERYIHIVNHEAHKYAMPESIPGEYKLKEVWG